MARRRYRKVTSGSGKSHQGRRITMAQQQVSSSKQQASSSSKQQARRSSSKQQQAAASSSKEQQQQASSRQAARILEGRRNAMLASICSEKIIKHVHTPCCFLCVSPRGGDPNATSRGEHRFPPTRARSSRWAAAGKQQQAAARSSKQQASSRQAARILEAEEMLC